MQVLRAIGVCMALLGAIVTFGCGASEGEPTVPVTGVVTYKGSPVEGAIVSFVAADGKSSVGTTDASGKYSLTTRKKDDGAIPGQYKVSITKFEGGAMPSSGGSATLPEGELHPADYTGEAPEAPPAKNVLPAKYANPESSGFTATVSAGENTHNFDLEG